MGGLVIFALAGTGAVASFVLRRADPSRLLVRGSVVVISGVTVSLIGVLSGSLAMLFAGSVVAGIGLGAGLSAFMRVTAPLVAPERRGALVAAIYVVTYLSFSVPTMIAGAAVTAAGLRTTAYGYGIVVIALAALTTIVVWRRLRRVGSTACQPPGTAYPTSSAVRSRIDGLRRLPRSMSRRLDRPTERQLPSRIRCPTDQGAPNQVPKDQ